MNVNDIQLIEVELKIELPKIYIELVLRHPFEDKEKFKNVYTSFLNDAGEIIDVNKKYREEGIKNKKWPKHLFIIGYNLSKSIMFIDVLNKNDERVFFLEREKGFTLKSLDKYKIYNNLKQFVEDRIDIQRIHDM